MRASEPRPGQSLKQTKAWLLHTGRVSSTDRISVTYREDSGPENTLLEVPTYYYDAATGERSANLIVSAKGYMRYLPEVFKRLDYTASAFTATDGNKHVGRTPIDPLPLEQFLWGFQHLWQDLDDRISTLHLFFDPEFAPAEFLEWLASRFALTLDPEFDESQRRHLVSHVMKLYDRRGTVQSIKEFIQIVTKLEFELQERVLDENQAVPASVKDHNSFKVIFKKQLPATVKSKLIAVLKLEKPAHTACFLVHGAGKVETII